MPGFKGLRKLDVIFLSVGGDGKRHAVKPTRVSSDNNRRKCTHVHIRRAIVPCVFKLERACIVQCLKESTYIINMIYVLWKVVNVY